MYISSSLLVVVVVVVAEKQTYKKYSSSIFALGTALFTVIIIPVVYVCFCS